MEWEDFKKNHKNITIDKTLAMELLDGNKNRDFVFFVNANSMRKHLLLTSSVALLMIAIIVTTVMWYMNYRIDTGYIPLSILLIIIVLSIYTRSNAVKILRDTCINDKSFYEKLRDFENKTNSILFKVVKNTDTDYFETNLNYKLIISKYADELMKIDSLDYIPHTKNLPYSKNIIKKAILKAIENTKDVQKIEELKASYILISQWQENATKESLKCFNVDDYNNKYESIEAFHQHFLNNSDYNEKCRIESELLVNELKALNLWNNS